MYPLLSANICLDSSWFVFGESQAYVPHHNESVQMHDRVFKIVKHYNVSVHYLSIYARENLDPTWRLRLCQVDAGVSAIQKPMEYNVYRLLALNKFSTARMLRRALGGKPIILIERTFACSTSHLCVLICLDSTQAFPSVKRISVKLPRITFKVRFYTVLLRDNVVQKEMRV